MSMLRMVTGDKDIDGIRINFMEEEIAALQRHALALTEINRSLEMTSSLQRLTIGNMPRQRDIRVRPEDHHYPIICLSNESYKGRIIRTENALDSIYHPMACEYTHWLPLVDLFRLQEEEYTPF